MRNRFSAASVLLITLGVCSGAALLPGSAAPFDGRRAAAKPAETSALTINSVPSPARFREDDGRGLLVKAWVNGRGPFTFAIDTGAGATILTRQIAAEARVGIAPGRGMEIGGLSGASGATAQRASLQTLAVGSPQNFLPSRGLVIVVNKLPSGVDGILDPTEAYSPFGYSIDLPKGEMSAFDPRRKPLRAGAAPPDGVVVSWLREQGGGGRRPFVMLAGGGRALLDTGSGFGLAVSESAARTIGIAEVSWQNNRRTRQTYDLAGGKVSAQRVTPATIHIGSLMLRGVPTDYLLDAEASAPILLGRDALRPFRLTFDPSNRLIQIRLS